MFIHGGIIHIAFNMWCLWNLGQLGESLYGRWTYACIYLICGVGASLAAQAWHPYVPSVGASGAIFGLAGALIAAFKLGEFSVPRAAFLELCAAWARLLFYNLIFGFALPGIDNAAHIGGLVTGLIVGALIAFIAPHHEHAPRRALVFVVVLVALAGAAMQLAHHYHVPLRLRRIPFARTGTINLALLANRD